MEKDYQPHSINFRRFQSYNRNLLNNSDIIVFELIVVLISKVGSEEVFHTMKQFVNDTDIAKASIEKSVKKLVKLKVINKVTKGIPKRNYYSLNFKNLAKSLPNLYRLPEDEFERLYEYYDFLWMKVTKGRESPFKSEYEKISTNKEFKRWINALLDNTRMLDHDLEPEYELWALFTLYYFVLDTNHSNQKISQFFRSYCMVNLLYPPAFNCWVEYAFTKNIDGNYDNFDNHLDTRYLFKRYQEIEKKVTKEIERRFDKAKQTQVIEEEIEDGTEAEENELVKLMRRFAWGEFDLPREWSSLD
ncbi:MAG: hypothetical protein ABFS32_20300 [Bacteroidota bacterium]